ncbi:transposon Tf2-8 polyprotein [Trichonephila clavipes]|nr:transposon Tf2-8 polyprotein [Trichonephila clavipes]
MIADQMKKRCSPECKEHYLDIWEELISPEMLTDKLEAFDNIRRSLPSGPRRHVKASETVNDERQVSFRKPERPPKREYSHQVPNERSPLRCYRCGKRGVIKSKCPTCNLNASQRTDVATNNINAYTAQTRSPRLTLIDITFCGIKGRVCAGTGSSHSIAGERMFQIFKDKELLFQETTLAMSLADGQQTTDEALTTQAKENRTLLGTDFLSSAGLVLDVKNTCTYFWDNPTHKYPFGEELDTPSIVEKMSSNTCQLREGKGESLTSAQKEKLNLLLESFQNVFEPGGEATNINTGNSLISVPPYRMSPVKKEILRKEIEDLLEKDIIEENELCEVCTVAIDVPSRSPKEIRDEQMKDEKLVKIISCLEDPDKNVNYVNWVERGYLMNQGILFRYAPDSESEEAQLVVPSHERTLILKNHHDAPMAGHYGAEGTYTRIAKNYYWTGMRKYITDYVKNCPDCIKYKASNQKPSGLLQTPVPAQRFETLAIDLFWPLRVKMVKDGSSSLRIVPPSGSNCLHYPMPQLKNVPLP